MSANESFDALTRALKVAVVALRDANVQFLLGGSLAAWARGAPRPENDLDLMVAPQQAERALRVLEQAGMRVERPPEEWLYKAFCGEVMIDVIFQPAGLPLDEEVFARAETISVQSVATRVMALEDVVVTKLNALDEHTLDYTSLLGIVRAVREQIDWHHLRARAGESPYAQAFFTLVEELGIAPTESATPRQSRRRVRVLPGV